jgi:SAM-dependent methyltransferase
MKISDPTPSRWSAVFFSSVFCETAGSSTTTPSAKSRPRLATGLSASPIRRTRPNTCAWLDTTFNGDFLPLTDNGSEAFFNDISAKTDGAVFYHLSAVVRGHKPFGGDYQPLLRWDWQAFDFAHIPVGLLSQVYEAFCWEWTPKEAQKISQHYTPRNIAVTLVDEVFENLPDVSKCRVLDPACGAGVFLVLAFRRLYLELWKRAKKKERPQTDDIRRILENQLVGLDISEAALKLAALSLYLTAIELDPQPQPPDKLRFKNLRGYVLHNVREPGNAQEGLALGSLDPQVGAQFDGRFDVVVCNPPWTSANKVLGKQMAEVCQAVIGRIDAKVGKNYQLPDNNPDLPFLWKATEWCKPSGRIAMALPARILLKSESTPTAARSTLFNLLQVDGIINGTNLSDTPVWPDMNQPWMLLFATNKRPGSHHSTFFVTLPVEISLNKAGQFRIDSKSARPVDVAIAAEKPWLWKALSVGTMLDVEIVEKMKAAGREPLDDYWHRVVGRNRTGEGYQIAETQENLKSCKFLKGLPNLDSTEVFRFVVDTAELNKFTRNRLWRPRKPTIYDPPLVLIRQAPGETRENGRALLAFEKIAYNRNFNGYSAAGHSGGELLVRYLHLFVHSDIWQYYVLVTSPQFGAERRRFHKSDLGKCPFVPFDKLKPEQRVELTRLSRSLEVGTAVPWPDIDAFFARLYGLKDHDLRVIRDTLSVALPYDAARQRACAPPTEAQKTAFIETPSQTRRF